MMDTNELERKSILSGVNISPFISFFSTSALLCLLFFIIGIAPFGPRTVLVSDLMAQYAPFLIGYKEQLFSDQMFSYSFIFGSGKNMLGLFAYYLSSPFNLLTFLFPKGLMSQAVVLIITLKLSFASMFMTLFLQRRSGRKDKISSVFGIMYALCSYAVVYMISIMWLDGFMLLPLILLLVERYLENNRKWISITGILFLLFFSGYYIAYMVGIFSFVYLIARMVEDGYFTRDSKLGMKTVLRFIGCAVLAAGLCAVLILPAGLDTIGNADYLKSDIDMSARFVLVRIFDQLFFGTFDSLHANLPLIYSGLITSFLSCLYFLNPAFSRRSKIVAGSLLAGFVFSFHFSILDFAWHLFDLPNWFQFRYSFLFVAMTILLSYLSLTRFGELSRKSVIRVGLLFLGVLIFVHSFGNLAVENSRFFFNLAFGVLFFIVLFGMTFPRWPDSIVKLKRYVVPFLVALIILDVGIINPVMVRSEALGTLSYPVAQVQKDIQAAELLVNAAGERSRARGEVFDRIEVDRRVNTIEASAAGPVLGIKGISTFQTGSNKHLHRFYKQLGFATNYNYFTSSHSYSSVVTDSVLGISHVISERDEIGGMRRVAIAGNDEKFEISTFTGIREIEEAIPESKILTLFEIDTALPAMFLVRPEANDFDFYQLEKVTEDKDYFAFQNRWIASMFETFDLNSGIYYPAESVEKTSVNASLTKDKRIDVEYIPFPFEDTLSVEVLEKEWSDLTYYLQINPKACMILNYEVVVDSGDPLYMSVPFPVRGFDGEIFVNGEKSFFTSHSFFSMISYLGCFEPGERVEVSIVFDKERSFVVMTEVDFYYCDTRKFSELLTKQDPASGISNLKIENGRASADVTTDRDRFLVTTIPFEPGWTLWVDGERTTIVPYQDAWIGVPIPQGTHRIELRFTAPGLIAGAIISGISVCVFGAFIFVSCLGKRKRK